MGEIRSAIDIAMEKAAGITGNPVGAQNRLFKNKGIKAASQFLENGDVALFSEEIKNLSAENRESFCNGAYTIFFAAVKVPDSAADIAKMDTAAQGLACLCSHKDLLPLMQQVSALFNRYLQEKEQIKESLALQFAPKLRQKEQELARLYGQVIHLAPEQDPEFADLLRKQNQQIAAQYDRVTKEIYAQLGAMTGFSAQ